MDPRGDKEGRSVSQDINVLALVKGRERYVFLYDDARRAETLRTLGRYASNPDLSCGPASGSSRRENGDREPSS